MLKGLERRVALSRLVLFLEAAVPPLVLPAILIACAAALALLGVFEAIPGWLHFSILLALICACLYLGRALPAALRWPDRAQGLSRIETDSDLRHRPLAMLEDKIGVGDKELWAAHRASIAARLAKLRLNGPNTGLEIHDSRGLRAAAILTLIIGAMVAQGDAWTRLERALSPHVFAPALAPVLEAWITPPAATGRPPVFLTHGDNTDAPSVPFGSEVTLHVKGARKLVLDGTAQRLTETGRRDDTIELRARLEQDATLEVSADGRNLARWPVKVIPDAPPKIAWVGQPQANPRGVLRLIYMASDQYGIGSVALDVIKPAVSRETQPETLSIELPPPPRGGDQPQIAFRDLTAHPWAGLDVVLQLEAKNAQGLLGKSQALPFTLPERVFNHPIAKQIIAERKTLARDPAMAARVARALSALSERPETFSNDTVAYLALRSAVHRLVIARGQVPPDIFDLLWNTALRIEDGELSNAAEALRQAQENLQQALSENKSEAEIDRLMQELRKAMNNYLQSMLDNAKSKGMASAPPPRGGRTVSQSDLQRLLDRAQALSRAGSRDAAREMLSMLQNMLESLQGAQNAGAADQRDQAASDAMSKLGQLMNRQQQLMDKTLRESQRGPRGTGSPSEAVKPDLDPGLEGQQQSLRKQLGDIIEGLGGADEEIPDVLSGADQAMKHAESGLQAKRPGGAAQDQAQALSKLREGTRALGERLMARQNGRGGVRQGRGGSSNDPLGRPAGPTDQPDLGLSVTVPDQGEIERAQRIMDELRRRAGERQRPKPELDYLDRLLERF